MSNRNVRLRLTTGERLLLHRRRAGRTQAQEAARFNVSRAVYGRWESDICACTAPVSIAEVAEPMMYELCLIRRRRSKMTQEELADRIGYCDFTIRKMEKGLVPCDPLMEHFRGA